MKSKPCGCCEGIEKLTPQTIANRPGLTALSYRVGTHASFFETMKACLSTLCLGDEEDCRSGGGLRPLQRLTTRESDDPSIALLDAWAVVADVLTFYQERIANEGYLLTATERRSILELARLVGYELRPGVSASVYLAFTLEKNSETGPDGTLQETDYDIVIPAGTGARSIPGPGELPQVFETEEDLGARTAWNAIRPRLTEPQYLTAEPFEGTRELFLEGLATNLKANDALLLVCGEAAQGYRVITAQAETDEGYTQVTYQHFGAVPPPQTELPAISSLSAAVRTTEISTAAQTSALAKLGGVVKALKAAPSLPPANRFRLDRPIGQTFNAGADIGPRLLVNFNPRLKDTLYAAYANAPIAAPPPLVPCSAAALRVKAAPFGHNAPLDLVYNDNNVLTGRREWALAELKATLDLRVTSTGASIGGEFNRGFDLAGGEFPSLSIAFSIADEIGTQSQPPITLGSLQETTPPGSGLPVFERDFSIRGVSVNVRAEYEEEGTNTFFLRRIQVTKTSGPQVRVVAIREGTVINGPGTSTLGVSVSGVNNGQEQNVAPGQPIVAEPEGENRRVTIALNGDLRVTQQEPLFATSESVRLISLDSTYDQVLAGSWVLIDRVDGPQEIIAQVQQARTISRADYGVTAKVTQLELSQAWLTPNDASLSVLRGTTIYAQSETLGLAEAPIREDVAGSTIELDGLYDSLEAGRWLVVSGERTDVELSEGEAVEGVNGSELVMLAGVTHDVRRVKQMQADGRGTIEIELPGDTLHTTLTLAEEGLEYVYKRDTVAINANVAKATHGETQNEVLGSGDGSKALQQFTLKKPPLTFLAAPTPRGAESTLEVRVNDIQWHEESSLIWLDANSRGFATRTDNEGKTAVIFGDGKNGARLPTGVENVKAVYRSGIGKIGNVEARQISQLAAKPLGVKEVINPIAASGGADPEGRDQARGNAPLAVTSLDRLVSVQDYSDFARTFAGIAKAAAVRLPDGRRQVVHLTIAGAGDIPIPEHSDLYRNLRQALQQSGDPYQPVQVKVREALLLIISAKLQVLPDYQWESVEPKLRAALLEEFSFERRQLGRDVLLSELISAIQAVEGVCYVDVDLLESISESEAEDTAGLADKLDALATASESARPQDRIPVEPARIDPQAADPQKRILAAQLAYLSPELPDTLILTEVTP